MLLLSKKFHDLMHIFFRKKNYNIAEHNIVIYLSDLTKFLGKTPVINCPLTNWRTTIFVCSKPEIFDPLHAVRLEV
jgi:hypothetical protein